MQADLWVSDDKGRYLNPHLPTYPLKTIQKNRRTNKTIQTHSLDIITRRQKTLKLQVTYKHET